MMAARAIHGMASLVNACATQVQPALTSKPNRNIGRKGRMMAM